ncbi:MAG: DUF2087 domain-containing protein [Burkholderiales bacterium]|nr:DUF2087 domain-containing protein [Burkholderiales bacterium]
MSTLNAAADAALPPAAGQAASTPARTHARAKADERAVPFYVENLSALAKTLREQFEPFAKASTMPSHVQLLNWLARAAGHRNYQTLRATAALRPPTPPACVVPTVAFDATLTAHATKAITQFDERGRLTRWPHKFAVQRVAMWALWQRFDARRTYTEREVNALINTWATFGDHATLRRELINMQLLARKPDCSEYWKEPQRANDEVRAFLRALRERTQEALPPGTARRKAQT